MNFYHIMKPTVVTNYNILLKYPSWLSLPFGTTITYINILVENVYLDRHNRNNNKLYAKYFQHSFLHFHKYKTNITFKLFTL